MLSMIFMNYLPRCSAASETDARDVSYESESSRDVVYDFYELSAQV